MSFPTVPFAAPAGRILFSPGTACPGLIELETGRIRVSLTSPGGREVVLYRVGPGEMCLQTFACLIGDSAYGAEGVAETALAGHMIPAAAFRASLGTDAALRERVLQAVAHRFAEYEHLVEDVALTGFDARLARVLLRLADSSGRITATHDALAAETASGRAVVSRRLGSFAADGLVRTARGEIEILDRAALQRIAADQR